jgi:hypothetical protein
LLSGDQALGFVQVLLRLRQIAAQASGMGELREQTCAPGSIIAPGQLGDG